MPLLPFASQYQDDANWFYLWVKRRDGIIKRVHLTPQTTFPPKLNTLTHYFLNHRYLFGSSVVPWDSYAMAFARPLASPTDLIWFFLSLSFFLVSILRSVWIFLRVSRFHHRWLCMLWNLRRTLYSPNV